MAQFRRAGEAKAYCAAANLFALSHIAPENPVVRVGKSAKFAVLLLMAVGAVASPITYDFTVTATSGPLMNDA